MLQHDTFTSQEVLPAIAELRSNDQWLVWRYETREGNATKVPYQAANVKEHASSTDEATWNSYEVAQQAFEKSQLNGRWLSGVGYALNRMQSFVDLDHCVHDGVIDTWAKDLIDKFDSYAEFSPSGTGVHIIIKGCIVGDSGASKYVRDIPELADLPHEANAKIELYSFKRYFTITEDHVPSTPTEINFRQTQLNDLYTMLKPARSESKQSQSAREDEPHVSDTWTDEEMLDRAMKARNGEKFGLLWNSDYEEAGYTSQSEADMALCCMLAFWTGRNFDRIDDLFRQSGLFRPNKWDRAARSGETYGEGTIARAIEATEEVYTPATNEEPESDEIEAKPVDDQRLMKFMHDDAGNADAVVALYGDHILHNGSYGWMIYNGRNWCSDREHTVDLLIEKTLRRRQHALLDADKKDLLFTAFASARNLAGCKKFLSSKVYADISTFDCNPDLLNARNGVIKLRTGELIPHSHKQRFTYCVPVDYDPDVDTGDVQDFLKKAVGGEKQVDGTYGDNSAVIDFMQMAVGYSLTGLTTNEKLFYVYGPGRSGKGTFSEAMMAVLPMPLANEVDFNTFTRKREGDDQNFDVAPLKPARMVFASESNKYQTLNPGKIKLLTGGNLITCAFKHKDHFSYKPQYKIWLVSNHPVKADVTDDPLWHRVQVIEFPYSHIGSEDEKLKPRMKSPEVLKQWLAWAVAGAIRWYNAGRLSKVSAIQAAVQEHRDAQDTVKLFIEDCLAEDKSADAYVENYKLMKLYKYWCAQNEMKPISLVALTTALKAKGYRAGETKKVDGMTKRGVKGITLVGYNPEQLLYY